MARLTVYKDNQISSTVVSNLFIDEYMKDANDAQIKVYLYLLRMMNAHQATSVPDIADKFNHTEKEVIRALKYWEKQGLLNLDYDSAEGTVTSIRIHDLCALGLPGRNQALQSVPTFVPMPAGAETGTAASRSALTAISPSFQTPALTVGRAVTMPADSFEKPSDGYTKPADSFTKPSDGITKPSYTPDQLRSFLDRQNTAQLLGLAEAYIGKPLTASEMKSILYISDELHFSDDLIDYLMQYCVDRGHKSFHYIEKTALEWAKSGITTPGQAQEYTKLYNKTVYTIMKELGKNTTPAPAEADYIIRWVNEYGFSMDIILEACRRTVLSVDKNRFEFAEKILKSWKEQNVRDKSDIVKIDDMFHQRKKTAAAPSRQPASNRFNQFPQNDYDFEALEKALLSN